VVVNFLGTALNPRANHRIQRQVATNIQYRHLGLKADSVTNFSNWSIQLQARARDAYIRNISCYHRLVSDCGGYADCLVYGNARCTSYPFKADFFRIGDMKYGVRLSGLGFDHTSENTDTIFNHHPCDKLLARTEFHVFARNPGNRKQQASAW